jgi:hypothetical protein
MEQTLEEIKERNRRVELDKAWETSYMRRGIIAVLTYIVAFLWLSIIENERPFMNALVPCGGYLFSTLSLPFAKRWWIKNHTHDN